MKIPTFFTKPLHDNNKLFKYFFSSYARQTKEPLAKKAKLEKSGEHLI